MLNTTVKYFRMKVSARELENHETTAGIIKVHAKKLKQFQQG